MTIYKPGQIVLVPFPFTDFSTTKQRPAIIISSETFNNSGNDIIVLAITSHITPKISKFELLLNEIDQRSCGLPKPSIIKVGKIISIDKRLIRKIIGELPKDTFLHIKDKLTEILG